LIAGGEAKARGRAVLVTGASRGIGAAVARAFAAAGDRVAVHYGSRRGAAEETLASLPGERHALVGADLADPHAVRRMVDRAARAPDGLDVVVNNAGVYLENEITHDSYEQWQQIWSTTLAVNLVGAANVTWCAVRHMLERGAGRVVNVSSRGAFRGEPEHLAYAASKAALNAFGQSLARALGPHGIAVATVAPGFVDTDMAAEILAGPDGDQIRAQSPFGRVATPEEVASAVLFLASPEAEFASGTILDLNGASYLRT
jgi:NAD(P)-dependent dehydrogenase (short-subunit alcohol dehydrogenase family)